MTGTAPQQIKLNEDRRSCTQCTNLAKNSRCRAAQRGEIVAIRNYEPIRDILRRCEGYAPGSDDSDKRSGLERWFGVIDKGDE